LSGLFKRIPLVSRDFSFRGLAAIFRPSFPKPSAKENPMERRRFLKTVLSSSLAVPLAAASKFEWPSSGGALYLISDSPQATLPDILAEVAPLGRIASRTCALSGSHPFAEKVRSALLAKGWSFTPGDRGADVLLSFAPLSQACLPSFTFVQNGRVVDVRENRLRALWKDISQAGPRSSVLTVATFGPKAQGLPCGGRLAVYLDGKKKDSFDLAKDRSRTFESAGGFVTVGVEGGSARVVDSSCRHKVCAGSGSVSGAGERIICAPNRFFIEVEGRSRVDAILG